MSKKPIIGITMGDAGGIGPEIIAKIFSYKKIFRICNPMVIGDIEVMRQASKMLNLNMSIRKIKEVEEADFSSEIMNVYNLTKLDPMQIHLGKSNKAAGGALVEYIKKAAELALNGKIEAITTAPINKEIMNEAGFNYSGHTELLAKLTNTSKYAMMLIGGPLRVILVTTHAALSKVPSLLNKDKIVEKIKLAHQAMKYFGIDKPKIAVTALNPHAGEGGLFGKEEIESIIPAVKEINSQGIDAVGPFPSDTLFFKAKQGEFDAVVVMYHDQGLIPLKMLSFGRGVNVTIGLPIIRTSVDHGTAYDIAGKGIANSDSLWEALKLAAKMFKHKEEHC